LKGGKRKKESWLALKADEKREKKKACSDREKIMGKNIKRRNRGNRRGKALLSGLASALRKSK